MRILFTYYEIRNVDRLDRTGLFAMAKLSPIFFIFQKLIFRKEQGNIVSGGVSKAIASLDDEFVIPDYCDVVRRVCTRSIVQCVVLYSNGSRQK